MEAVNAEERRRKSLIRCLGFGWCMFPSQVAVYVPNIRCVRPPYGTDRRHESTVSVIEFIGSNEAITVPGSTAEIVEALMDALGVNAPHAYASAAAGNISGLG